MLAAGNRVIIKPSEFTPHTGALLAKTIKDIFPEDLVTVVKWWTRPFETIHAAKVQPYSLHRQPRSGKDCDG
jgi:acyl-CoA reductase-like NAD-dependent aldehyde dehydrogenase